MPEQAERSPRRGLRVAAGLLLVVVPLALVPALGGSQGGYFPDTWVWAGALLAWAAALALVLRDEVRVGRIQVLWLLALGALLGWTALSALWSTNPSQSLLAARRDVVYVAAALALVVLGGQSATRRLTVSVHVAISLLLAYAVARYLLGPRYLDEIEGYVLAEPVGYANGIGILAVMAMLLASGAALHGRSRLVRAASAGTIPGLALVLALTSSRASWAALALGAVAIALLETRRRGLVELVVVVAAPGSILLAWLVARSHLAAAVPSHSRGTLFAAAVATSLVTGVVAALLPSREQTRTKAVPPAVVAWLVPVAAALAFAAAAVSSLKPRGDYWHVAWRSEYLHHPILGSGGGTFGGFWLRFGDVISLGGALNAHSLYLETLAELGPFGLALLVAALCLPLVPLLDGLCPPYAPQAAGAYGAFLLHAGLDWDWQLPGVTIAALCCAAALLAAEDRAVTVRGVARAAAVAAALLLGLLSIAGARSKTEPGAGRAPTVETAKAPQLREAFANLRSPAAR